MIKAGNLTRKEARERADVIWEPKYEIVLDLADAKEKWQFNSHVVVEFDAEEGANSFIDILAHKLTEVTLNGEKLDVDKVYKHGRVQLEDLLVRNVLEIDAVCDYSKTGEGLHRFVDPSDGEVYLYSHFEVPDAKKVYACFDQPDIKGVFTTKIITPKGWTALSNGKIESETASDSVTEFKFEKTCIMPTYLTAFCAGPYTIWNDELTNLDGRKIPLGLYARKSVAKYVDVDEMFEVTKEAFDYYGQLFPVPYPYTKYDQIFCPEYNAGAMENVACVTITETYIFRTRTSTAWHERRAITVIHELAHMWFGDLVTMKWWNDLWLNESFAEFMATTVTAAATKYRYAWVAFSAHEKIWALRQDQLSSSHPISAEINNLEDVMVNFDGITYAKGASVLRQLVAYVGEKAFYQAITDYLNKYRYSNAVLQDLLTELERTSGRDLKTWSKLWLQTQGVNTFEPIIETNDKGRITRLAVRQTADPAHPHLRPHRINIGFYDEEDERIINIHTIQTDINGEITEIPEATGRPRPRILLLNDQDLTFTKVRFDEQSLENIIADLDRVQDPLTQAILWGALYEMVRDGLFPAERYIRLTLDVLKTKTRSIVVRNKIVEVTDSLLYYVTPTKRAELLPEVAEAFWNLAVNAKTGSDAELQFCLAFANLAVTESQAVRLQALLDGTEKLPGVKIEKGLIWNMLYGLAALGKVGVSEIEKAYENDKTADGLKMSYRALASIPDVASKQEIFDKVAHDKSVSNVYVRFASLGFNAPIVDAEMLEKVFMSQYFDCIRDMWQNRSFQIAEDYIKSMYPRQIANQNLANACEKWLANNKDADAALLRLVRENLDDTTRDLRNQKVT
ncbi:MAG: aminopeptidase N [Bifidobacteriaceae bacterium]|jgi:aminopeptidase N|nr:aminopeptidase N [Bifidobacteriaceae bacterium]